MDRRVGNTQKMGAIFGVLAAIGVPVPAPGSLGFQIAQTLNGVRTALAGEGLPQPDKLSPQNGKKEPCFCNALHEVVLRKSLLFTSPCLRLLGWNGRNCCVTSVKFSVTVCLSRDLQRLILAAQVSSSDWS